MKKKSEWINCPLHQSQVEGKVEATLLDASVRN